MTDGGEILQPGCTRHYAVLSILSQVIFRRTLGNTNAPQFKDDKAEAGEEPIKVKQGTTSRVKDLSHT